jgi:hypothetical protein
LRTRYLIVILLYILATASAGAINNPEIDTSNYLKVFAEMDFSQESILTTINPYDDLWLKRISKPSDNHSAFRSSSLDLNGFDPHLIFKNDLLKGKNRTTKDYIKLIEPNQMNDQYLSRGYDESILNIDYLIFESDSIASVAYSDLKFISENKIKMNQQKTKSIAASEDEIYLGYLDPYNLKRPDEVRQAPRLLDADDSYRHLEPPSMASKSAPIATQARADNDLANDDFYPELSAFETERDEIKRIAPFSSTAAKSKTFRVGDSFRGHLSDLRLMEKASVSSFRSADSAMDDADLKDSLDTLIRNYENAPGITDDPNPPKPNFFYSSRRENVYQNYAVVVGINKYEDRMSLQASANDARSVADLLKSLGYKVILLSDNSGTLPTKHNILNVALNDPDLKKCNGNVIFYFSGHGLRDKDGTFYLIPKDANGHYASYISDSELKVHLKDLKNLAVIVDACNGGGFSSAIGEGQLIMASSRENEPSNEEWTGSFSVFTQNLINAIREQSLNGDRILLRKCFDIAYNDTVRWSRLRMMSQTPVLIDLTNKEYVLK